MCLECHKACEECTGDGVEFCVSCRHGFLNNAITNLCDGKIDCTLHQKYYMKKIYYFYLLKTLMNVFLNQMLAEVSSSAKTSKVLMFATIVTLLVCRARDEALTNVTNVMLVIKLAKNQTWTFIVKTLTNVKLRPKYVPRIINVSINQELTNV